MVLTNGNGPEFSSGNKGESEEHHAIQWKGIVLRTSPASVHTSPLLKLFLKFFNKAACTKTSEHQ
jgi:hypothetical protein